MGIYTTMLKFLTRLIKAMINISRYLSQHKMTATKNLFVLKVSKFRKQIFQPTFLPKNKPTNLFFYPDYLSGSFGWKICFRFLLTFSRCGTAPGPWALLASVFQGKINCCPRIKDSNLCYLERHLPIVTFFWYSV